MSLVHTHRKESELFQTGDHGNIQVHMRESLPTNVSLYQDLSKTDIVSSSTQVTQCPVGNANLTVIHRHKTFSDSFSPMG